MYLGVLVRPLAPRLRRVAAACMAAMLALVGLSAPGGAQSQPPVQAQPPAQPQPPTKPDFAAWLAAFKSEAQGRGIGDATLHAALDGLQPLDKIIEFDRRQPEFTLTFQQYLQRVLTEKRIEQGRRLLAEHREVLRQVAARYQVPPKVIVAMWGIETDYGRVTGGYPVVAALATLAYDGRRSQYFRDELMNALVIIDRDGVPATTLRGSWAGAMGQCQFMPSTYLKYARHWPDPGAADIWTSHADVFASTANYLANIGWNAKDTWGRPVRLTSHVDPALTGLGVKKTLREWEALGVREANGRPLPRADMTASLIHADSGKGGDAGRGPPYLVYDNFRVLMQWNRSVFFALSAAMLADRLASR